MKLAGERAQALEEIVTRSFFKKFDQQQDRIKYVRAAFMPQTDEEEAKMTKYLTFTTWANIAIHYLIDEGLLQQQ